jgi:acylphosphatase
MAGRVKGAAFGCIMMNQASRKQVAGQARNLPVGMVRFHAREGRQELELLPIGLPHSPSDTRLGKIEVE